MSSSLASQLAARTTLDSARLQSTKTLKNPPSFIFSPRHAASVSTADLHALASNAWEQLASLDPFFEKYQVRILGEEAKTTDRSSLTKEENDRLGQVLDKVMRGLSKYMLLKPAGVVLEWLVRRFRVNDLNVPSLVAMFMPYHTTAHFPSALNLISETTLRESGAFGLLIDARASMAPLALPDLVSLLPPFNPRPTSRSLLDFLLRLPLPYLEAEEKVHRSLVGFWLQFAAAYIDRAQTKLPEGERAVVLSTILEVLRSARDQPDLLIATYILLARFCLYQPFEGETLRVVVKTIVSNKVKRDVGDDETDAAFVTTLIVVTQLGSGIIDVGEGKRFLGGSGWKSLMKVRALGDLLVQLCNQYDANKFMKPFLDTLTSQAPESQEEATLLSSLLLPREDPESSSQLTLPDSIVAILTSSAVSAALAVSSDVSIQPLLRALSQVHQRWPLVWSNETSVRSKSIGAKQETQFWSLVNAVLSGRNTIDQHEHTSNVFLSSASPDVAVRIKGLQNLLQSVERVAETNPSFVHDTFVARLCESSPDVIALILSSSSIPYVHQHLTAKEIIDSLLVSIASSPDPSTISIIYSYLANAFSEAFPDSTGAIVKQFFWSRLLNSRSEQASRMAASKALRGSTLSSKDAWLKGLDSLFVSTEDLKEEVSVSKAAETNAKIIEQLAKNLSGLHQPELEEAQAFLLAHIARVTSEVSTPSDIGSKLLSSLVAARLASQIKSSQRVAFAARVLAQYDITTAGVDVLDDAHSKPVIDTNTGRLVLTAGQLLVTKMTTGQTEAQIRAALLLSVVDSVQAVKDAAWNWLTIERNEDSKVIEYQSFVHSVYRLAHLRSSQNHSPTSNALLRSIYTHLIADDTLCFLASIYSSNIAPVELRVIALRDAGVYVKSQAAPEPRKPVDWQVVVASLIIALGHSDRRLRVEALNLVSLVLATMPSSTAHIYGREKFYGPSSTSTLQYLDVTDTKEYLTKLVASKTELLMDGSYLNTLHASLLDADPTSVISGKKKISLKVKVVTFLLSHALTWRADLAARTVLLRTTSGVKDSFKAGLVLPILRQVVEQTTAEDRVAQSSTTEPGLIEEFGRWLLQPYESASKKWIDSEAENNAFATFIGILELEEMSGLGNVLRREAYNLLAVSLFAVIRGSDRLDVFKRLLRLGCSQDSRLAADPLKAIRSIKVDIDTIVSVITDLRVSLSSPVSKGAKRGRSSIGGSTSGSATGRTERIPELLVVFESIEFSKINANNALLLALFALLSTLIEIPAALQTDVQYPGQLVLSALSQLVSRVDPNSGIITTESIRMSPVLDFMRTSTNPQTYHQALLLLAQLGPLVPDQLVHHVMPIFTFVGANVIQRDDAYSLRVVDQTLDSIIPALVKSTKRKSNSRAALVADLKDLLHVFADAAEHMPRHRRVKLFVRFVQTLGASEFLSAVAVLLAERDLKMADGSSLALLVVEHFKIEVQLAAFHQIIEEASHLLEGEPSFLDRRAETDDVDSIDSTTVAVQVDQLLTLLDTTLESRQLVAKIDAARAAGLDDVDNSLTTLLRALLELAPQARSTSSEVVKQDLAILTNACVQSTVYLMSTSSFSEALLWLLDLSDSSIQSRAFALLKARLPQIKPARRAEVSPAVVAVIDRARTLLSKSPTDQDEVLETLDAIVSSTYADEDTALAKIVPELMSISQLSANDVEDRSLALTIIAKLSNRLGPRLIPLVAKLVPFAVASLHTAAKEATSLSGMIAPAFQILEGLFVSIPTFIGSQVDKVFDTALSADIQVLTDVKDSPASKARASLLSTAAKKLPSKTLYPAIVRLHASLGTSPTKHAVLGLLDVLNRALRHGKVSDIAEAYRSIFKLFLSIFDLRRVRPTSLNSSELVQIEDNALGAFVQFILKLNEQIFRPLFLRTYDWAVIDLVEQGEEALVPRRVVLFKLMDRLLSQLRSIAVPYFSFMLDQSAELLEAFSKGTNKNTELWTSIVSALTKSIEFDESGFWTPLRLGKVSTAIADQVLASHHVVSSSLIASHYNSLISHFSQRLVAHERLLKQFNVSFLMHTRSDDLRVKRASIEALERLWIALGDGMLGLVPETTPFLSETLEETEGGVEKATRSLIKRIEDHLGENLDSYLEA